MKKKEDRFSKLQKEALIARNLEKKKQVKQKKKPISSFEEHIIKFYEHNIIASTIDQYWIEWGYDTVSKEEAIVEKPYDPDELI